MTRNVIAVLCISAGLLLAVPPMFAHHSASSEFDENKPLEFTGTVRAVEWVNPHGYVQVDVKDPSGKIVTYRVEIMAPNGLYRAGWTKNSTAREASITTPERAASELARGHAAPFLAGLTRGVCQRSNGNAEVRPCRRA